MTNRRQFLQRTLAAIGLTTLAAFLYPLVKYFSPPQEETGNRQFVLGKKEIPLDGSVNIVFNNTPCVVINRADKGYIALSRVCTHLGCLVDYQQAQKRLLCPCHGGTYDLSGNVTSGPPPKPLKQFPLKVEGDSIIIG